MIHDSYRSFRREALEARSLDTLIGLCKGIVADGQVNQAEAEFLLNWLRANREVAHMFPANVIYPRIVEFLADGCLDKEEGRELLWLLRHASGEEGQQARVNMSTAIAFDDPQPVIEFEGSKFCLTGQFAYGSRSDVADRIRALGGVVSGNVLKKGCYLVIGCMSSQSWLHETHGTKITKAVEARAAGCPVAVISEEHWCEECQCTEGEIMGTGGSQGYSAQLRQVFKKMGSDP
ncbi:BRCT domain-containing protein [Oceanidesulfovibrio marinus]|uniref:BRCT domain-containing protein n=1 Tax=Oceanidesulfovibrio marinus TaxID=370038 RepID=A0ABX6NEF4_9BACT|nr:BRCT domain-containing protein [Oceanidesulfovibrio marinus]QJT08988.1 hypothetical protein E8L03_08605 [Oceanidesulfovibrio marinus]